MDRRTFIELGVQGTVGVGLSTIPLISLNSCSSKNIQTFHAACYHDCPDRCSWKITAIENGIKEFEASTDNPFDRWQAF